MILVDSSVWIDYFRGVPNRQTDLLDALLGVEPLVVGDLILTEVLQGFTTDRAFKDAHRLMRSLPSIEIAGLDVAVRAARNYRFLRQRGQTVHKTIDCVIATRCIEDGHTLLFSDRDFQPFVDHLGLATIR